MDQVRDFTVPGDLSALAWVQEELRRTLDNAHKSLRRHLRDLENQAQTGTSAPTTPLLQARNLIHQAVGAMDMVGLPVAARFLSASEQTVQHYALGGGIPDEAAVSVVEHASFGLLDYLRRMLAGKPVSALMLFPQYRAVLTLAGLERNAHPSDLWDTAINPRSLIDPGRPVEVHALPPKAQQAVDAAVLAFFRGGDAASARKLSTLFAALSQSPVGGGDPLWPLTAAFFEAQAEGLLTTDLYVKRVTSRLLTRLREVEKGQTDFPDQLLLDLLFFCARARLDDTRAPLLRQMRARHHLPALASVDYERSGLGRYDPALVPQARKRVATLKESWSALTSGELALLEGVSEQAAQVTESVQLLYPEGALLAASLQRAVDGVVREGKLPRPELAMEVATTLLCLDASLDDVDLEQQDLLDRVQHLAQRLDTVTAGHPPQPIEPWVEALYRDISDRQSMGSVVQELRALLAEVESQLDRFSRNPNDHEALRSVPTQLGAMRGVLSVLGLDQASQAVQRMRDDFKASQDVAGEQAIALKLADNLGALSFLIDMLAVQPQIARSLFRYEPETGRFHALMGRAAPAPVAAPAPAPAQPARVAAPAPEVAVPPVAPVVPEPVLVAQPMALPQVELNMAGGQAVQPQEAEPVAMTPATEPIGAVLDIGLTLPEVDGAPTVAPISPVAALPELSSQWDVPAVPAEPAHDAFDITLKLPDLQKTQPQEAFSLDLSLELANTPEVDLVIEESVAAAAVAVPAVAPVTPVVAVSAPAPAPSAQDEEVDAEMREIFIEEAREVIVNAREALSDLSRHPQDSGAMTVIRRAYHTLKGSSRMVGLREFGEAAWACEQLSNARLAEVAFQADLTLRGFIAASLDHLEVWIERIAGGTVSGTATQALIDVAEQLRRNPGAPAPSFDFDAIAAAAAAAVVPSGTAVVAQSVPQVAAVAEPVVQPLSNVLTLDAPDFVLDFDADTAANVDVVEAAPVQPVPQHVVSAAIDAPLELDFSFDLPEVAEVLATPEEPPVSTGEQVPALLDLDGVAVEGSEAGWEEFQALLAPEAAPGDAQPVAVSEPVAALDLGETPAPVVPIDWLPAQALELGSPDEVQPPQLAPGVPPASAPAPDVAELDLDLDFGFELSPAEPVVAAPPPASQAPAELDFLFGDELATQPPPVEEVVSAPVEFGAADLDFSLDLAVVSGQVHEPDAPLPVTTQLEASASGDSDLDLDFDLPAPVAQTAAEVLTEAQSDVLSVPEVEVVEAEPLALSDVTPVVVDVPEPIEVSVALDESVLPEAAPAVIADSGAELDLDFDLLFADESPADPQQAQSLAQALDAIVAEEELPSMSVVEPAVAEAPAPVASVPTPVVEPAPDLDRFKSVGHLQIPIALFNIYLSEADEQSRRLATALAEWQLEVDTPVSDTAVALAHSLAGNSATVGYAELSALARRLEHALQRSRARGHGRAEEAVLYVAVADEVRRLLQQFAAGMLSSVDSGVLALFDEHESTEAAQAGAASHAAAGRVAALGAPRFTPMSPARAEPVPARKTAADTDAVDVIDPELFEIFAEEGKDLLPELAEQLRTWSQDLADMGAGAVVMRALHTFKGGARLAGAMRLGELAHRLETTVEHVIGRGVIDATQLGDIEAGVDVLSEEFQRLLSGDIGGATTFDAGDFGAELSVTESGPILAPLEELAGAGVPASAVVALQPAEPAVVSEPVVLEVPVAAEPAPVVAVEEAVHVVQAVPARDLPIPALQAAVEEEVPAPAPTGSAAVVDWARLLRTPVAVPTAIQGAQADMLAQGTVRVRAPLLDRLVNHAGEVGISRARIQADMGQMQGALRDLTDNLERLRRQLRDLEIQAESQMTSRMEAARQMHQNFDPLEMDRFTRVQELTRMMAESVNDVGTVQRGLLQTLQDAEDQLINQMRLTRDLQDDLLRARMVEFDTLSDRLYRVVRQSAKESGKQVRLNMVGGALELDRAVLERMAPPFEHLLRNAVVHGIETPTLREAVGKDATGTIEVTLHQMGNEVQIEVRDDGAGLNLARIAEKAHAAGLLAPDAKPTESELAGMIFRSGFTTAAKVTELAGRGVGMDVVRAEVTAMGGRIETSTATGLGTVFKLVLPLTTAVTQVALLGCGDLVTAVPATLVDIIRRVPSAELEAAYRTGTLRHGDQDVPFFWLGSLLQADLRGPQEAKSGQVLVVRSASQYVALHVSQVIGNQEVVVKNLGVQLSRMPGLAGMSLLPSGNTILIYNPVALAAVYGEQIRARFAEAMASVTTFDAAGAPVAAVQQPAQPTAEALVHQDPLVMVVDDSLTVRRVTQRLLVREGYRVVLAKDGLDALEKLADEKPGVMLCDIEMPRMDGFDLVRNVRSDPRLADIPVVMITSRIAQKHREHAAELGVDHYLGKPYDEEKLLGLVRDYTTVSAARAAASA